MNFKFLEKVFLILVVSMAIFFRTNNLEGKLTFEWDQSRDYDAASRIIETGKLPLLGPIVRGDIGGFYLGPLYYYLVTPLYSLSGGNPLALSAIGIGMDLLVIVLLYALLKKYSSVSVAMIAVIIYSGSPLIIRDSYTPWNVSLISAWVLLFLSSISAMVETDRFRYKFATIFLISLTAHIHLSLIPVVAVLLLFNIKSFIKLSLIQYSWLLLAFLLPISTLIYYDATHSLENLRLFKQFMLTVTDKSGGIIPITQLVLEKYGYTIGRLFTGEPYTYLGWFIATSTMFYTLLKKHSIPLVRFCVLTILSVIFALIYYHDFDFAEYYFLPAYIPTIILTSIFLGNLVGKYLALLLVACIYIYLGWTVRMEPISPYSLTVKKEIVGQIKNLGYPVEVRTKLPRERNTAFPYLMKTLGVVSESSAPRKAYIYESKNLEVVSPPEARSIILDHPIEAFKLIIFSN